MTWSWDANMQVLGCSVVTPSADSSQASGETLLGQGLVLFADSFAGESLVPSCPSEMSFSDIPYVVQSQGPRTLETNCEAHRAPYTSRTSKHRFHPSFTWVLQELGTGSPRAPAAQLPTKYSGPTEPAVFKMG